MQSCDIKPRILQHYPVLQALQQHELDAILTSAMRLELPAGSVLFDDNQPCQGFPLLLKGSLRVVKSSPNGRELRLYRVSSGESCIMTSSCLLGDTRYQARGIAEEDVEIVLLPALHFHALLGKHDAFRGYVFRLFTERLTDMMELVTAVAFQKLDQRLASLLVAKQSPIRTTHQAIADELGSAREIVSRLLKGFAEQGWLELGRERITLTDEAALKKFAAL